MGCPRAWRPRHLAKDELVSARLRGSQIHSNVPPVRLRPSTPMLLSLVNTARLCADFTFSLYRFSLSSLETLTAAVLVAVRGAQILLFVRSGMPVRTVDITVWRNFYSQIEPGFSALTCSANRIQSSLGINVVRRLFIHAHGTMPARALPRRSYGAEDRLA